LSTDEEIREVYLSDIADKSRKLRLKQGLLPWLRQFSSDGDGIDELSRRNGLDRFQIFEIFQGLGIDDLLKLVGETETSKK